MFHVEPYRLGFQVVDRRGVVARWDGMLVAGKAIFTHRCEAQFCMVELNRPPRRAPFFV